MEQLMGYLLLLVGSAAARVLPLPRVDIIDPLWQQQQQHLNRSCDHNRQCDDQLSLQHLRHVQQYMRPEINPCVDFHAYACGNWHTVHGPTAESAMALSGQRINERYLELFERLHRDSDAPELRQPVHAKLLRYYESCKRAAGSVDLLGYMEQLQLPLGGHWLELLAQLGRYGYSGHYVRITISQHNATQHNIGVEPHSSHAPALNLSESIYAALRRHTSLGREALQAEFVKLEADLADIVQLHTQQTDDETMSHLPFAELKRSCGELDWQRAFTTQLGVAPPERQQLLVDGLDAIKHLAQYLNNADGKLLELYSLARFLNYLQEQPHSPLGRGDGDGDGLTCARHMRKTLYLAMNYAYELNYYAPQRANDERILHTIFAELKAQFARTLVANEMQLSADLLQAMHAKLQGLRLNVGNMPPNASQQFYHQCVEHLNVSGNFYANHLQSLLHYHAHLASFERHGDVDGVWYSFNMHGPEMLDKVDATPYFYCLSNIIVIPYAYLQLPFYDAQLWPSLLYGDLANTLGHELLHAFDTYFVDYDAHGNLRAYSGQLRQNERYMAHVNCLNDSAVLVLDERTADVSGTRLALQTYMMQPEYRREKGKLYFLQFAQFFCGDDSDEYHDAGSKRLNYTLAQMPEFAEVFDCPAGTPMNPPQRCSFW